MRLECPNAQNRFLTLAGKMFHFRQNISLLTMQPIFLGW